MSYHRISMVCCASALVLLSACSSSPPRNESTFDSGSAAGISQAYGRVSQIEVVSLATRPSGAGAVLGAVIGGVLGSQVGGGTGRDVATGVGVIGGAVIGNQIERRNKRDDEVYRVHVRLDSGRVVSFDYQRIDDLRVGDRVRIVDGQLHRG
jgi:outer membrane lipoprotein SlyB